LLRKQGPISFGRKTAGFFQRKIQEARRETRWRRTKRRGKATFSVGSISSDFVAEDRGSIEATEWRISSEERQLNDLLDELREDDIFFDVGANTGIYTCFAAQKCAQVVSFEPYPPNLSELEENIKLNEGEVTVINKALSNKKETKEFSVPEEEEPGHGHATFAEESNGSTKIQSIRGDDLVESGEVPQPNVVKIDVEGAEPLVIEGLEETLRDERCRLLYCEFHLPADHRPSVEDFGSSVTELWERIENLGFNVEVVWGRGSPDFHLKARRSES